MHILRKSALAAAGVVALAACQPPAPSATDTAADVAAIQAVDASWGSSYNAGNADAITTLYTEDAVLMPPGAPAARGHAAMKEWLTADMAKSTAAGLTLTVTGSATDAGASGDLGWHTGTYSVTDKAGATVETGKWLETLRKADGKWHISHDIWNADAAAAAPAAAAPASGS